MAPETGSASDETPVQSFGEDTEDVVDNGDTEITELAEADGVVGEAAENTGRDTPAEAASKDTLAVVEDAVVSLESKETLRGLRDEKASGVSVDARAEPSAEDSDSDEVLSTGAELAVPSGDDGGHISIFEAAAVMDTLGEEESV